MKALWISIFEQLVCTHSWWDTVDMLATHVVGEWFKNYPEEKSIWINIWRTAPDMWLNRTCLLFQLNYKQQVDTDLLTDLIIQFSGSSEFFIQKAIGWVLREYSKQHPDWVKAFAHQVPLKSLSKREALRKLPTL